MQLKAPTIQRALHGCKRLCSVCSKRLMLGYKRAIASSVAGICARALGVDYWSAKRKKCGQVNGNRKIYAARQLIIEQYSRQMQTMQQSALNTLI